MKRIAILLGLGLVARVAVAALDGANTFGGTRVTAEIVSIDRARNTITLRSAEAAGADTRRTLPVQGAAAVALDDLSARDAVVLTCRAVAGGVAAPSLADCTAVTSIRRAGPGVSDFASAPALESPKVLTAVVVFADEGAQTLIVKDPVLAAESRPARTLTVDAKAAPALRDLRGGEAVRITCRETGAEDASPFGVSGALDAALASTGGNAGMSACSSVTSVSKAAAGDSAVAASPPFNAVVVSADAAAATLTVTAPRRHDAVTLVVEGRAAESLSELKLGQRVRLTCRSGASAPPAKAQARAGSDDDVGWSMARTGQCAAVTEIAKTKLNP